MDIDDASEKDAALAKENYSSSSSWVKANLE